MMLAADRGSFGEINRTIAAIRPDLVGYIRETSEFRRDLHLDDISQLIVVANLASETGIDLPLDLLSVLDTVGDLAHFVDTRKSVAERTDW